jgi:hypothetical protein
MVFVMSVYNMIRIHGFNLEVIATAWLGFPLAFTVAMIGDCFIAGPLAKKVAFKIVSPTAPKWQIVTAISGSMVTGMVLIMSLFGALVGVGFTSFLWLAWLYNIPANFVVALPLQLLIAGPLVRLCFRKLFPIGVITA